MTHEVLTVKDDKDQHLNYRRSKAGLQIFHNTIMTGLIHKTVTKAAILKFFGLRGLQFVKKRRASGRADKKVVILTFSPSAFYSKIR